MSKSSRPCAGRGVDEARAGIVGDVVAVEQRNVETVAQGCERMGRRQTIASSVGGDGAHLLERLDLRRLEHAVRQRIGDQI